MEKFNISLAGAGRRISFIKRLKDEGFNVTCYETDLNCPAKNFCKVVSHTTPYSKDSWVLPLMDCIKITSKKFITFQNYNICYDKLLFSQFMLQNFSKNYPAISHIKNSRVIEKPRFGRSSQGISYLDYQDYRDKNLDCDNFVYQSVISGTEYSVDAYWSRQGKFISAVPRIRQRTAGGESVDTITVRENTLIDLTKKIGNKLNFIGPACFQFMIDENTQTAYCFEINARFGGACIASLEAGWNALNWIKSEYYNNQTISEQNLDSIKWGLQMRRYFNETFNYSC